MDIPTIMQHLIDELKADKQMAQPYRNYAVSDAIRLQAVIRQGMVTTNMVMPSGAISDSQQNGSCICPPAGRRVDCPIHGNTK
jgi:hypothetical protein